MHISDPVVVAESKPYETRWGYFQFPAICRLPGGEIMVTVSNTEDATSGYGDLPLRYLSTDEGQTWHPAEQLHAESIPPAACSPVFNGEHLVVPGTTALDVVAEGIRMPEPAGKAFAYQEFRYYDTAECPARVQEYLHHLPALRWTPGQPQWTPEQTAYDVPGRLCWTFGSETAVSRTWLEHAPICHNGELLYVDYRTPCRLEDGSVPQGFVILLMASADNGRSFHKRSIVAVGRVFEPILADTPGGDLVCVIRGTDQEQQPMSISYSQDHGLHWEEPRRFTDFGVFPALVRLDNGTLLMAYGRPGVWASASLDGAARNWSTPAPIIAGDAQDVAAHTCGYTGLLPVGRDEALLVYSNFKYINTAGQPGKSIEVRRIKL